MAGARQAGSRAGGRAGGLAGGMAGQAGSRARAGGRAGGRRLPGGRPAAGYRVVATSVLGRGRKEITRTLGFKFLPQIDRFNVPDRANQAILSAQAGLVQGEHAISTKLTKPHVWGAHAHGVAS
jgi:hypothetical protein